MQRRVTAGTFRPAVLVEVCGHHGESYRHPVGSHSLQRDFCPANIQVFYLASSTSLAAVWTILVRRERKFLPTRWTILNEDTTLVALSPVLMMEHGTRRPRLCVKENRSPVEREVNHMCQIIIACVSEQGCDVGTVDVPDARLSVVDKTASGRSCCDF